jgi:hypothetical protein
MTNLLPLSRRKWRAAGYYVEGTESINRMPGGLVRRKDLFGFVDLIAVPVDSFVDCITLIQTTSWSNVSARFNKINTAFAGGGQHATRISDLVFALLRRDFRIVIEGWKLNENHRYVCREVWVRVSAQGGLFKHEVRP